MHPGWEGLCQHRRDEGGRQHAMDDQALEGSRAREALVEVHRVVIVRRLRKQQKVFLRKGLGICRRLSDVDVVEVETLPPSPFLLADERMRNRSRLSIRNCVMVHRSVILTGSSSVTWQSPAAVEGLAFGRGLEWLMLWRIPPSPDAQRAWEARRRGDFRCIRRCFELPARTMSSH